MNRTILIAGGSGLIGTYLREHMISAGYQVRILSRNKSQGIGTDTFYWNPTKQELDPHAFQGVDVLINLAGASIADKIWTKKRKKTLRRSRIDSTRFLLDKCKELGVRISTYLGGSAVGVYGDRAEEKLTEESTPGRSGFLVDLCLEWEAAHDEFSQIADRVIKLRTGIVLSDQGGAWPQIRRSAVMRIGACFGKGNQYMPWIHIEDQIRIMRWLISSESQIGLFNAVSPSPVTNREFLTAIIKMNYDSPWLVPIPSFLLKAILGEMSAVLLDSQRVLPTRLLMKNFKFKCEDIDSAIRTLSQMR